MNIYLTALIKAKPGKADQLKGLLKTLVAGSTQEAACLQYELHQSSTDEHQFLFHETWQDAAGLELHNSQPHLQAFVAQSADILDGGIVLHHTHKVN